MMKLYFYIGTTGFKVKLNFKIPIHFGIRKSWIHETLKVRNIHGYQAIHETLKVRNIHGYQAIHETLKVRNIHGYQAIHETLKVRNIHGYQAIHETLKVRNIHGYQAIHETLKVRNIHGYQAKQELSLLLPFSKYSLSDVLKKIKSDMFVNNANLDTVKLFYEIMRMAKDAEKYPILNSIYKDLGRANYLKYITRSGNGTVNVTKDEKVPDRFAFSYFLHCYLNLLFDEELFEEAVYMFDESFTRAPRALTLILMIHRFSQKSMFGLAGQYWEQFKLGYKVSQSDENSGRRIMYFLAHTNLDEMYSVYKELLSTPNYPIPDDFHSLVLYAFYRAKNYERVISIYEEMVKPLYRRVPFGLERYAIVSYAALGNLQLARRMYDSHRSWLLMPKAKPWHDQFYYSFFQDFMQMATKYPEHCVATCNSLYYDAAKIYPDTLSLVRYQILSYIFTDNPRQAWKRYKFFHKYGGIMKEYPNVFGAMMYFFAERKKFGWIHRIASENELPRTVQILNALLVAHMKGPLEEFERFEGVLAQYEDVAWDSKTFQQVVKFYAKKGNFLLSWNMWLKYLEWADENGVSVHMRVVRAIVRVCIEQNRPQHLKKVWDEAILKRGLKYDEKLFVYDFIRIPRGFRSTKEFAEAAIPTMTTQERKLATNT